MTYRPATDADRPPIVALLRQADLLTDDLPDHLGTFTLACADDERLAGVAGLEVFNETALLRSVAVTTDYRDQLIGNQLIDLSMKLAERAGVETIYLITTTADRYFERLGFVRVNRADVPDAIAQTRQFSQLCPDSAVTMSLRLQTN